MQRLRRLVADLDAAVDDVDRELVRAYATAWDTVVDQLADAVDDLAERGELTQAQVLRSSRIASALAAIGQRLDGLAAQASVVITGALGRVVSFALAAHEEIAATQLPARHGLQFATVNPDVIGTIVARTSGQITARTRPLAQAGQDAVRLALVQGAAAADNPVKVARDMVRLARAGAVDLPRARAQAIARTELLDAGRQATQAWEQANAATLSGWEWHSSRSVTTCPSCWAMDGTLHELAEPGPDDHPNGRCTRLVRTKTWAELGFDLPEPAGLDRPSAEQAFRALPAAQQLAVMGPARLAALNAGTPWSALSVERPNPDWRRSFAVTPVRDLFSA
jgi:hypothetical protein